MYTKILVALDGSWMSEGILPHARFFANALKVSVELLQVIEPDIIQTLYDPQRGQDLDVVEGHLKSVSQTYLERVASSFQDKDRVNCTVEVGKPAEVIIDKARREKELLVAMSTHGHSGMKHWFLGSVTEKVLYATTNHLLLVRRKEESGEPEPASLKTILVPLDGSKLAEQVLTHVASLAQRLRLGVILVRVHELPLSSYLATEDYVPDLPQLSQRLEEEAKNYLEMKAQQLRAKEVENVSTLALSGKAAEKIIDVAWKTTDNLVMMCTHGRSGIGRWVIGSVTSCVVRHSNDPVLVIRASNRR